MKVKDFDFQLPDSLIALNPPAKRDESRLLVLHGRGDGRLEHRRFYNLIEYLRSGDMLLLNKTKVLPVRLMGIKPTGGELEILLLKNVEGASWEILSKGRYTGRLVFSDRLSAEIHGGKTADLKYTGDLREILYEVGAMPLPPYIRRKPEALDKERYQTVYAEAEGSVAAPTAGLHFTEGLLKAIEEKGVLVRYLTLHVGRGTFAPIRAELVADHQMEAERFELEKGLIEEISAISALGGRLFAVGTTVTRTIEGFYSGRCLPDSAESGPRPPRPPIYSGTMKAPVYSGTTDIFIYPGHKFRAVKGLITNFHLPGSTPLMLTSAFAGRERLLKAYESAIGEKYRFFSYGDAMLLL